MRMMRERASRGWHQHHSFAERLMRERQFFRIRTTIKQKISLAQQREMLRQRLEALKALALVA